MARRTDSRSPIRRDRSADRVSRPLPTRRTFHHSRSPRDNSRRRSSHGYEPYSHSHQSRRHSGSAEDTYRPPSSRREPWSPPQSDSPTSTHFASHPIGGSPRVDPKSPTPLMAGIPSKASAPKPPALGSSSYSGAFKFPPSPPSLKNFAEALKPFMDNPQGSRDSQGSRNHPDSRAPTTRPASLTLEDLRLALHNFSTEELHTLVFAGDDVSKRLLNIAYGCPSYLQPDYPSPPPGEYDKGFVDARQACNAEMTRRCKALCTSYVRSALEENCTEYIPYMMKQQARRNLQKVVTLIPLNSDTSTFDIFLSWLQQFSPYSQAKKGAREKDSIKNMIIQVAKSIADPGQAALELQNVDVGSAPALPSLKTLIGAPPTQQAVSFTLDSLRSLTFDKLHSHGQKKSLDWALDQVVNTDMEKSQKEKIDQYRVVLNAICLPKKGAKSAGKGGPKVAPGDITKFFKEACGQLGIRFEPNRNEDLISIIAAIKANSD